MMSFLKEKLKMTKDDRWLNKNKTTSITNSSELQKVFFYSFVCSFCSFLLHCSVNLFIFYILFRLLFFNYIINTTNLISFDYSFYYQKQKQNICFINIQFVDWLGIARSTCFWKNKKTLILIFFIK